MARSPWKIDEGVAPISAALVSGSVAKSGGFNQTFPNFFIANLSVAVQYVTRRVARSLSIMGTI